MKTKLLTDVELRARWSCDRSQTYYVEKGTILTPSARDFVREHGIQLCTNCPAPATGVMTVTSIPFRDGKAVFQDAATGQELDSKPEAMTHLRANLLVPKVHPRIAFRGGLDSLMAQMMGVQMVAEESGLSQIALDLDELMEYSRKIMAAEVKDEPLSEIHLLGMDSKQLRYNSHQVKKIFGFDHPVPNYKMGRMCVSLNRLRTQVREVELAAARAFYQADGTFSRTDIIEGLNRMSSCVYIILCRKLSGYYDRGNHP